MNEVSQKKKKRKGYPQKGRIIETRSRREVVNQM